MFGILFILLTSDFVLESKLETSTGVLERFVSEEDEREFFVQWKDPGGKAVLLEDERDPSRFPGNTRREPIRLLMGGGAAEAVVVDEEGVSRILGLSPRQFESEDCRVSSKVHLPTPLGLPHFIFIDGLVCLQEDMEVPLTQLSLLEVLGFQNKNWVWCSNFERFDEGKPLCLWDHTHDSEALLQSSVFSFLWMIQEHFSNLKIKLFMKKLVAKAHAWRSNRSLYDAHHRTLFYGEGLYPDGLDGFIVLHEWGHALVDDLNSGVWGYEAHVIHEALADFLASDYFKEACFASFEAQEKQKKCLRDLKTKKSFPKDMTGELPHEDSLILSSALWELQKIIPSQLLWAIMLESLIRSPKDLHLQSFWIKMEQVYVRLLKIDPFFPDRREDMNQIGTAWGFKNAFRHPEPKAKDLDSSVGPSFHSGFRFAPPQNDSD